MLRHIVGRFKFFRRESFPRLQYISDLHLDINKTLPKIVPKAKYLAVCGDLCIPSSPYFRQFLQQQSNSFERVFFVPGNHEFDSGSMFDKEKVQKWEPIMRSICNEFPNIHYLNRNTYQLTPNILIAGSILWSRPILRKDSIYEDSNPENYLQHVAEHNQHVEWVTDTIQKNNKKKIIMLTHFVPTFRLIEPKYQQRGIYATSRFATDLEHLIKEPLHAWICGHSHSVIDCNINGVHCAINAYGYSKQSNKEPAIKIVD
jgi:hypothetical protein